MKHDSLERHSLMSGCNLAVKVTLLFAKLSRDNCPILALIQFSHAFFPLSPHQPPPRCTKTDNSSDINTCSLSPPRRTPTILLFKHTFTTTPTTHQRKTNTHTTHCEHHTSFLSSRTGSPTSPATRAREEGWKDVSPPTTQHYRGSTHLE